MHFALAALGALALTSALTVNDDLRVSARVGNQDSARGCTGGCENVSADLQNEARAGFKSRPKRQTWEARLKKIVVAASAAPCEADIVATSYGRHMGLGSRMNSFADEFLAAVYRGRSFSLCRSRKDHFIERIWSPHFQNVASFPVCESEKKACRHGDQWDTLHIGQKFAHQIAAVDREYLVDMKLFLYKYIFTLSNETQQLVDKRLSDAGLSTGQPYVAVHVRHGDKWKEAKPIETDEYSKAARPFLQRTSDRKAMQEVLLRELEAMKANVVYVSSDDVEAADEIQRELMGTAKVVRQPPEEGGEGFSSRNYQYEDDIVALLTDVEALRRAAVFVGTASSNIGRLAYFLRPKDSMSISLDRHGDWLSF